MQAFVQALEGVLPKERIFLDEPMSRHTTFKIGGPADCLLFPASVKEVTEIFKQIHAWSMPFTVLGNGSNVLVLDKGIRGVVIKLNSPYAGMHAEGERIFASAGALLADVSKYAAEEELSGLEFAVGIPGSIGGAVFMNAGAYDGEIQNVVTAVTAVDADGNVIRYDREMLDFGYRHSIFQDNGQVICEVELSLKKGDAASIRERMGTLTEKRESRQPLEMPSAGSTFKRPQGYFAGTLIENTELKGFRVGGAQISTKHAGFVVNAGNATAADVLHLIEEVQKKVYEKHGVRLYPEVRMIGDQ